MSPSTLIWKNCFRLIGWKCFIWYGHSQQNVLLIFTFIEDLPNTFNHFSHPSFALAYYVRSWRSGVYIELIRLSSECFANIRCFISEILSGLATASVEARTYSSLVQSFDFPHSKHFLPISKSSSWFVISGTIVFTNFAHDRSKWTINFEILSVRCWCTYKVFEDPSLFQLLFFALTACDGWDIESCSLRPTVYLRRKIFFACSCYILMTTEVSKIF